MGLEANKEQVRQLWAAMWQTARHPLLKSLLADTVSFRGSLGIVTEGVDGVLAYVGQVRTAFPDFSCDVEELVAEENRVVARLRFTGTHRGEIFGVPATGRKVEYPGIAIMDFAVGRINRVWVVGDTLGLARQLGTVTVSPNAEDASA